MDVYKMADQVDADYYDPDTGYTYKIQDYNKTRRFGLPTPCIEVYDFTGNFIGYAKRGSDKIV